MYIMNKNTCIRVQTPVGMSDSRDTGEGLGQGTVEGAIASSINLDNGVRDFFSDSEDEVYYSGLKGGIQRSGKLILNISLDLPEMSESVFYCIR